MVSTEIDVGLAEVGPRLKQLRTQRWTRLPRGFHGWKVVIPPERGEPELRTHEGYEWLYVLSGELRLILAGHDVTMKAGEVAEFDTGLPHWFGAAGDRAVEILGILSQGERIHVRAAAQRKSSRR